MRKLLWAGLTAALLFCSLPPGALTDEPKNVKRLLDKAIQALGGQAKLARAKAAHWRARGTFHGLGGPVAFTGEWWLQPPNQMKVALALEGEKLSRVTLLDGERGWMTGAGGTQEMSPDQVTQAKEELYHYQVTSVLPLRAPAFKLEAVRETKIAERPAAEIKVAHADHADILLFFDKQTGLLAKCARLLKDPLSPTEVRQESFYTDYKDFGGTLRSRKITIRRDDKDFVDLTILEFSALEKLDSAVFAHPE